MLGNMDILVDNKSLETNYHLLVEGISISSPSIKKVTMDIPGADGELDLSNWPLGRPAFENRSIQINCSAWGDYDTWLTFASEISNFMHGKVHRIVVSTDPEFYWKGRLHVENSKSGQNFNDVTITGEIEPYKYKQQKTVKTFTVSGSKTIVCENLYRPVLPVITTDSSFQIIYRGNSYSIGAGSMQLADIEFTAGDNAMEIKGDGTITFSYQEASL